MQALAFWNEPIPLAIDLSWLADLSPAVVIGILLVALAIGIALFGERR